MRDPLHPRIGLLATTLGAAFLGGILASGPLSGGEFLRTGSYFVAPLVVLLLFLACRSGSSYLSHVRRRERQLQQMTDLNLATIEALAVAIDAKDQTAQSHVRRVHDYAAGLAKAMGMSDTDIQGVKTAALLHDIGKLAIPEHILSKPGPLTPEEFQKVRVHPQVGAEIISSVPFPYPVAPLILSHHERWDGKGYPRGLAGEDIPLGARVLTVVDYFDAVMSDRPYHRAMSLDSAVGLLRQEAGKALDPAAVASFLDIYPRLAEEVAAQAPDSRRTAHGPKSSLAQPGKGVTQEPPSAANVFDDIARAHQEIYALYEIAQAMGSSHTVQDTMTLIASKLTNLLPIACSALFIFREDTDILCCQFAKGVDAGHLLHLAIRNGQGLVGWVARNRRPLVNARPSADLEAAGSVAQTTLQAALVCPLVCNERFIGSLAVYHTTAGIYTDDHRRILDRVSEQAAAVISNALAFEQTKEESLTDPLTSLPNTRSMFNHLTQELARANRLKSDVTLLVMDLDDFKTINDTYGHQVGDRALRDVANVLRSAIRPYDVCARYAGDEFIVLLSACGRDEGDRRRIELQRAIDNLTLEPRPGLILKLAISAGAAVFPEDGDSHDVLLATADDRMYRDKALRKGGNRTHALEGADLAAPAAGRGDGAQD